MSPSPRLLAIVLLLGLTGPLAGQDSLPAAGNPSPDAPRDSAGRGPLRVAREVDSLGRPIIRFIEVRGADIFDTAEARSWLPRLVNGLHVTTNPGIIRRELLVREGEPYDSARVAETARNLRNLGIFRKVSVDTVETDSGFGLRVFAQDGWSTQADVRFRSAGNQTDWQLALIERNLLGTATRFATRYRHTPDRTSLSFQFLQPRLVNRTVSLGLRYENLSDGERASVAVERPFFSLSDRKGLTTLFEIRNERVLQFLEGVGVPSDSLHRRMVLGRLEGATALSAGPSGYLRLGFYGHVRREDYAPWPLNTTTKSVSATFGPFLEWRRANYTMVRGFARMGRDEDVDVSNLARLNVLAAPGFLGYREDGIGLRAQARIGTRLPRGFAWVDAKANALWTAAGRDSGSVMVGGTAVLTAGRRHLLIGHADAGWIDAPLPATEFDLGFAIGPRGFPIHAFTGDRTYFTTAEYRYLFAEDLFKAMDMGLAGFVDHGGAWWAGSPRRTGTNAGLGLRLSASRAAEANPTRLDLVYRFRNDVMRPGWIFVIASGLVFNTNLR